MSVKLAIIGSKTNSKEVEKLFLSLGGYKSGYDTFTEDYYYYIDDYNNITGTIKLSNCFKWKVFTYNEFITKYPYKKEDVVYVRDKKNIPYVIESMKWNNNHVEYVIYKKDNKNLRFTETVENIHFYTSNINDIIELNKINDNKFEVLLDEKYESIVENGRLCIIKKTNSYPATYEECCKILDIRWEKNYTQGYKCGLISKFQELYIAKSAYLKIAGEEMGLDKPWEPDWTNINQLKYCIWVDYGEIITMTNVRGQHFLAFPTEEMRDAFQGNFKDLIEQCKELL